MTDSTQRFVPGKLAFRIEHTRTAHRWVAYFVPAPALDADLDDVELGSIAIAAVADDPATKAAFMNLMRNVAGNLIEQATGYRPEWNEATAAPEHERCGHA